METMGPNPSGLKGRFAGVVMNTIHSRQYEHIIREWITRDVVSILDIGCGAGITISILARLLKNSKLFGIDHSPDMIRMAERLNRTAVRERRIEFLVGDVHTLPYSDSYFDVVTAFDTVNFWSDMEAAMQEIVRVLKKAGSFIIVNGYPQEGTKWYDFVRFKSADEYVKFLEQRGFFRYAYYYREEYHYCIGDKMMFLDPDKPLSTCKATTCKGCPVADILVCHFNGKQLSFFISLALPLFLGAGYAIFLFNPLLLIPWLLFIVSYFGLIEIRVMCSHCPHNEEEELQTLKYWANYGSPKLWKYRPGPMSVFEKFIFIAGLLVILLPPAVFLLLQQRFVLTAAYMILLIVWKILLRLGFCRRCINFVCPFNVVDQDTREIFREKNNGTV